MEHVTERKKAILETTLELIKENGFHGCPISLVVKKSGVAAGTIYHHFDNKDRLITELFDYVTEKMLAVVKAADQPDLPYRQRFITIWKHLYRYYLQNPNVPQFFDQYINSPYFSKQPADKSTPFHRYLFDFIRQGIDAGELKAVHPQVLGIMLSSSVITSFKIHSHGKISADMADLEQMADILWEGVATS